MNIKTIKSAGIDPGFANFGIVRADLDVIHGFDDDITFNVKITKTFHIKTNKTKQKEVRVSSDSLDRAKSVLSLARKSLSGIDLIFCEMPTGGAKSSSAAAGMLGGICIVAGLDKQIIQVTPDDIKIQATGCKKASKMDVIKWAAAKHPEWTPSPGKKDEYAGSNEHIADAIGAIYAGLEKDDFQIFVSGLMSK